MSNKVFWGIIVILLAAFFGFLVFGGSDKSKVNAPDKIAGVKTYNNTQRNHTQQPVKYAQTPSTGGNHYPVWIDCTAKSYDQQLPEERATHSLEHGAVWIAYKPDLPSADIQKIKDKVKQSGNTFSSPYQDLQAPIVLSAWDNQLDVSSVDDPRIDQFMVKYRKGPQTPEPGATCVAPQGST